VFTHNSRFAGMTERPRKGAARAEECVSTAKGRQLLHPSIATARAGRSHIRCLVVCWAWAVISHGHLSLGLQGSGVIANPTRR
jgi:hypothetical protein